MEAPHVMKKANFMKSPKIKILLAKLGLDVHNRGIITVANILRNAGMEVVYLGNAMPQEIISSALQEGVDVVGVSSLSGAHLSLGKKLLDEAWRSHLLPKTVFLIGGVFPPDDAITLKNMGFDSVFLPGATGEQIVSTIIDLVRAKQKLSN